MGLPGISDRIPYFGPSARVAALPLLSQILFDRRPIVAGKARIACPIISKPVRRTELLVGKPAQVARPKVSAIIRLEVFEAAGPGIHFESVEINSGGARGSRSHGVRRRSQFLVPPLMAIPRCGNVRG